MASRLRHALRHYSTILSPNSSTPLTTKQKSKSVIHLLKSETNPERILDICRAASLTPNSHLDRLALSAAISKLKDGNHFSTIDQFLRDLPTSHPDLRNKCFLSQSIVLYGQAKMLPNAVNTFTRMRDELQITPSVKSLNALLFAALIAKDYKEVTRIYLDFPKTYSIQPNAVTFSNAIEGFYSEKKFEEVGKMLKTNWVSFSHLIHGYF